MPDQQPNPDLKVDALADLDSAIESLSDLVTFDDGSFDESEARSILRGLHRTRYRLRKAFDA